MRSQAAFCICQSAFEQQDDLLFRERLQRVNPAAREQRRNNLERRIFSGRADQANVASFHMRQKRILLGFVEAVNLVNKYDGARAVLSSALRLGHHLLDFLDPGQHSGELNELRLRDAGDDLRQRGFASTGRSPEDERAEIIALDLRA